MVLNLGLLLWESTALTTGRLEYSKSSKFNADTHDAITEKQPYYANK